MSNDPQVPQAQKSNYYQILRIDPYASDANVRRAIEKMRQNDRNNHYKAVLDAMEFTLLHPTRRMEYNEAQGLVAGIKASEAPPPEQFVDVNEEVVEHRRAQRTTTHSYNRYRELSEQSVMSAANQKKLKRQNAGISKTFMRLFFVLVAIAVALIVAKPTMDFVIGRKQVANAEKIIKAASQQVEAEIKKSESALNKPGKKRNYFPSVMQFETEDYFIIELAPLAREINLKFNDNAVGILQDKWIRYTFEQVPNYSFWKCSYDKEFPAWLKPKDCF